MNLLNLFYKNNNGEYFKVINDIKEDDSINGFTNSKFTLNQETLNNNDNVDDYMFTKCV